MTEKSRPTSSWFSPGHSVLGGTLKGITPVSATDGSTAEITRYVGHETIRFKDSRTELWVRLDSHKFDAIFKEGDATVYFEAARYGDDWTKTCLIRASKSGDVFYTPKNTSCTRTEQTSNKLVKDFLSQHDELRQKLSKDATVGTEIDEIMAAPTPFALSVKDVLKR